MNTEELDKRLTQMEANINAIKNMLQQVLRNALVNDETEKSEDDEIMNVKQVAAFLGLDGAMIYAKCAKQEIPFFKIGKQYRFKKAEILKWMTQLKGSPEFSVDDYVNNYLQKNQMKF